MKSPFSLAPFLAGKPAFVEKKSTEYMVKYEGTTNLSKFPFTVAIGDGADPDYAMITNAGVLNTGEQTFMKAPLVTQPCIIGAVKGYVNVYKNADGAIRVGTHMHTTAANAKDKAHETQFPTVLASGVAITW